MFEECDPSLKTLLFAYVRVMHVDTSHSGDIGALPADWCKRVR